MIFFKFFLISHDLDNLKKYWPRIWQHILPFGFVWCFAHDDTGVVGLEEDSQRWKAFASHRIRDICYECNITGDIFLDYLINIAFARLHYCKVILFLHFTLCSFKASHWVQSPLKLRERGLNSPAWNGKEYTYLEFFCKKHYRQTALTLLLGLFLCSFYPFLLRQNILSTLNAIFSSNHAHD